MERTIDSGPGDPTSTSGPDPVGAIIDDFHWTMVALKCAASERLLRLGISMAQLNILYTLLRSGEMPMSRLAEVQNVSLSNATGLVDRLEERGYIERTRVAEDRRVVLVRLTAGGAKLLEDQDAMGDYLMRRVLARLKPGQLTVVAQATADLREAVEATMGPLPDRHPLSTAAPRSASTMRGIDRPSEYPSPIDDLAARSQGRI